MKKSLILMTAAATLLVAIPAYAQPSISNVAQAKSSVKAANYTWHFEVSADDTEDSSAFYPSGDRLTLTVKQSSNGKTKIKYWLYEDKTDKLVDYATLSGNHDEKEPVFENVIVDTNKKYRVEAQNKGNKTTKGTAYISY
ncbi:hypothetical protein [Paenibacillus alvei]|uniref:hypothetical protein n=1 Tax=Paenibacillus alvei TaxID=44250 RepID=UPI000386D9DF|nr:hypothetical protein [Paenibacillus alvei]EPY12182.1 hypothetical protein PAAL66ix_14266 [Paenibacillus alvei A6-6i-x]